MKYLVTTVISATLAILLAKMMVVEWNPEFRFWQACINKKQQQLSDLQKANGRVAIFVGGSSCSFSIAPDVIERETGIKSYNLGGAAPMGAGYLLSLGLQSARPGDVLVVALEPSFLTCSEALKKETLGVSLAVAAGQSDEIVHPITWDDPIFRRRPGAHFVATLTGKKVLRMKGYRYSMEDFSAGGRLETQYRDDWKQPAGEASSRELSSEGIRLIKEVRSWADENGVVVCYSMPWTLTKADAIQTTRENNQAFLDEIRRYMPVLHDPAFGADSAAGFFADTLNHLTYEGAVARSRAVSISLAALMGKTDK